MKDVLVLAKGSGVTVTKIAYEIGSIIECANQAGLDVYYGLSVLIVAVDGIVVCGNISVYRIAARSEITCINVKILSDKMGGLLPSARAFKSLDLIDDVRDFLRSLAMKSANGNLGCTSVCPGG